MRTALGAFDLVDLRSLYEAHEQACRAYLGVYNRPNAYSTVIDIALDGEMERCSHAMRAIADEAESRRPSDTDEAKIKAEILVRWGLECGSWEDAAAAMSLGSVPSDGKAGR